MSSPKDWGAQEWAEWAAGFLGLYDAGAGFLKTKRDWDISLPVNSLKGFNPLHDANHLFLVLDEIYRRHFDVHMVLRDGDVIMMELTAGDCNCPHKKPYDPKDGHGYTSIDMDDEFYSGKYDKVNMNLAVLLAAHALAEAEEPRAR